ncbi:MAG: choice-of-anchor D domain-containing protein, partial [Sphingobacteriia bacterium]|nr:choice-of-anchor D domain-containing protein [Candidatus Fonsibacter lacus]
MKKIKLILFGIGISNCLLSQTLTTGPSSSQSPYLLPSSAGYSITSILTATNVINNYTMSGIPDGAGAYDNNDGTFTFILNHEFGPTVGSVRAHGQIGAFLSKWIINKTTLAVTSGADVIQNVNLWNAATSTYSTYNAQNTSSISIFARFCAADLPEVSAFYNSYSGKGTQERIFMNGEENGSEGRGFAHILTGPNAGNTFELPYLGKFSWENAVANPNRSDKTIVIGTDDATPGQVYVYVGNKSTTGSEIYKAGLMNGILYGVSVAGFSLETQTSFPSANTTFSLTNVGPVNAITGASLNTISNNLGVTNFLRPEDGCWDPSNPNDFYFATTNSFGNPSRLWKLHFNNINSPELGGTISAVLDGTEGQQMLDNVGFDNSGHIILLEDVGNNAHIGKIWEYTIATDNLIQIAEHDQTRFLLGAPNYLTQDEEASGMFDAQAILGPGKFLFVDQSHNSIPAPVVEGGQILVLTSQKTATSNPEVNVQGNSVNIPLNNTAISALNNTDFGTRNTGTSVNKTFLIQNTGTGALVISSLFISGTNAGDFTFVNAPVYPLVIAAGASQSFTVSFNPAFVGTRSATVSVNNNDYNENLYDFAIQGVGAVAEINLQGNNTNIISGSNVVSPSNNTDFGSIILNNVISKTFNIQNTDIGTLTISNMSLTGSSEFTLVGLPSFPINLAGNASQSFTVDFKPTSIGTKTAQIKINNTDADESIYSFMIQGMGLLDVSLNDNNLDNDLVTIFPNPSSDETIISLKSS